MTVEVAREVLSGPEAPMPARPVAFDGLFGWLHPGVARRGVVLCGTLGFEQLSAYRAWRTLAEGIAEAGCTCLRFDYPGEGDSGEDGAGRVAGLARSVRQAIRYLREQEDAQEIVLVGLRFGAMVAALAAQEGGVDRLLLLAPVATGRAYLREMQLQARTTVIWPGGGPLQPAPGTLNVHGFVLSSTLLDEIRALDADVYAKARVADVLVVDGVPAGGAPALPIPGPNVRHERFAKFGRLLSGEMNFKTVAEVVETFGSLSAVGSRFCADGARPRNADRPRETTNVRIANDAWAEGAHLFGDGMFGILCEPVETAANAPRVLFINSGTYVRSGPSRFTTRAARTLAARGVASFRVDLRGMGDSSDWPGTTSPLYDLAALADVRAAIAHLQTLGGGPIVLVGFCSGSYLAFHAACRDERVTDAVLMNLYCFDWPDDICLETALARPTVRGAATYARSLLSANTWRRIIRRDIAVLPILAGILKLWPKIAIRRLSLMCRLSGLRSGVVGRVATMRRRGGRLVFVYSADDPGMLNIQAELGLSLSEIGRVLRSRLEVIDRCDHNFSTPESQSAIVAILGDLIDRRRRG